jgi:hypothetical protein
MTGVWLASFVALWLFMFFLAFMLAGALRQIGLITLRLGDDPGALITESGLDRGTIIPPFGGIESDSGAMIVSTDLQRQARVLTLSRHRVLPVER